MTTNSKTKEEFVVWSVIVAVFVLLTLMAMNFESIHKALLPNT